MKRLTFPMLVILAAASIATAEIDTETFLANVAKATTNALAIVRFTYEGEAGSREMLGGTAICYDAEKGEFMTLTMDLNLRSEAMSNMRLVLPGHEHKSFEAELMGIIPSAGISFIRAKEKHNWQAIEFVEKANLRIGQKVVSVGLMPGDLARTI